MSRSSTLRSERGIGSLRSSSIARVDESLRPATIELHRQDGLTVVWSDGVRSSYSVAHLRRMSPSAEARALREALASNPLTVLPAGTNMGALEALDAELIGNYAVRIRFSDGHATGLYSWQYLRDIDPASGRV
ncbi:MAG: DUF971 domain-containing protein [Phycisphaerales bacterium]|nr:DUF971 domain-containing protein [Phycisphaerales bacterium]